MAANPNPDTACNPGALDLLLRALCQRLKTASGWIDWDDIRDRPRWRRGAITLDGRFTVDELRALILCAGHACRGRGDGE
ncbi:MULTISPECIES: hypothetical protein [unclassified Burkholderia]|uniref:hypothetical protein n=1 Tax=unclassified Burkholderia TaxID=2613784 RepID=UPI00046A0E8E|nr:MULTISPECIES: hypothetical protein [unclassified Burkholderia]